MPLFEALIQCIRQWRMKLCGVRLGHDCQIGRGVRATQGVTLGHGVILQDDVKLSGNISLGDHVTIQKLTELTGNVEVADRATVAAYSFISTMPSGHISIGKTTLINAYSVIGAGIRVDIGDDCIFAPHINITDSSHAFKNRNDSPRNGPATSNRVSIGNGTWLGAGVSVLSGVQIGEGCVVGAGAVVISDLPDYSIAVGVPARIVRERQFSNPMI